MPEFTELAAWHRRVVQELTRAPLDRHHEWRNPSLATVDPMGVPQARTVVLRAARNDASVLHVYTDRRTPKVQELLQQPRAALLFWSRRLSMQLRVHAQVSVRVDGPEVEAAWLRMSQAPSAADYLSPNVPGSVWESTPEGAASERHQLAILEFHSLGWDALLLAREGHRRASWVFDAHGCVGQGAWLVP